MKKRLLITAVLFLYTSTAFSLTGPKAFPGIDIDKEQLQFWYDSYRKKKSEIDDILGFDTQAKNSNTHVNSLIESISPYLLRHAFNPIVWREWSSEALRDAQSQEKLVFLSIGYSSCHWCHVMESESFVDEKVAATINRLFIPIKVDKEVRPHLNHRYTLALELMTGSSGWPITAVLTPQGDVVYINAYLDKDELNNVLERMAKNWEKNPQLFMQSAALLMQQVDQLTSLPSDLKAINKELLADIYTKLESRLDWKYGGLQGKVKFPEPALFELFIDLYQRHPHERLREFNQLSLDNLYQGNLYDQVHGGFYRYSTDAQYLEPHFEKMLYTQAYMIKVYTKAYTVFNRIEYLDIAKQTLAFVDNWFLASNHLFYSAVDADYNHVEGGYYLWSLEQKNDFQNKHYQMINWQKIGKRFIPAYPLSEKQNQALRKYTASDRFSTLPFVDKKIIVAWNALMAQGLVALYSATSDKKYLIRAELVADKLWSEAWDEKSQKLNRIILNERVINEFNPEDSIELALLSLSIYEHTQNKKFLDRAEVLFRSIEKQHLNSNPDSTKLYSLKDLEDFIAIDGEGSSPLVRFTYLLKQLKHLSKQPGLNHKYEQLKKVVSTRLIENVLAGISAYKLLNDDLNGELKFSHYFAGGRGYASLEKDGKGYALQIKLDKGWHVNSRFPLRKELIATEAKLYHGSQLIDAQLKYPRAVRKTMAFSKVPLSLYEERFTIQIYSPESKSNISIVELTVQACSDNICLLPEKLLFPLY